MIYYGMDSIKTITDETVAKEVPVSFLFAIIHQIYKKRKILLFYTHFLKLLSKYLLSQSFQRNLYVIPYLKLMGVTLYLQQFQQYV
jgi:hypothetical protein